MIQAEFTHLSLLLPDLPAFAFPPAERLCRSAAPEPESASIPCGSGPIRIPSEASQKLVWFLLNVGFRSDSRKVKPVISIYFSHFVYSEKSYQKLKHTLCHSSNSITIFLFSTRFFYSLILLSENSILFLRKFFTIVHKRYTRKLIFLLNFLL